MADGGATSEVDDLRAANEALRADLRQALEKIGEVVKVVEYHERRSGANVYTKARDTGLDLRVDNAIDRALHRCDLVVDLARHELSPERFPAVGPLGAMEAVMARLASVRGTCDGMIARIRKVAREALGGNYDRAEPYDLLTKLGEAARERDAVGELLEARGFEHAGTVPERVAAALDRAVAKNEELRHRLATVCKHLAIHEGHALDVPLPELEADVDAQLEGMRESSYVEGQHVGREAAQ